MNLPNILSFSRIPILFIIAILLYIHIPWGSAFSLALLIFASFTDWLDGYVARKYEVVTEMGKLMDAVADKILILGLFTVLLTLNILPQWCVFLVLIVIVREFFITALRMVAASKGMVLAAEKEGKLKTVFQLISLGVLMTSYMLTCEGWCKIFEDWNEWLRIGGIVLFVISVLLTMQSGYLYLKKYGRLFEK